MRSHRKRHPAVAHPLVRLALVHLPAELPRRYELGQCVWVIDTLKIAVLYLAKLTVTHSGSRRGFILIQFNGRYLSLISSVKRSLLSFSMVPS